MRQSGISKKLVLPEENENNYRMNQEATLKKPKIMNYTTSIQSSKTVMEIEDILISFGAVSVQKNYNNGDVISIAFVMKTEDGRELPFMFRMNDKIVKGIADKLSKEYKKPDAIEKAKNDFTKARNIGWRFVKDMVHANLSLVYVGTRKIEQAFLSDLYNFKDDVTFFEKIEPILPQILAANLLKLLRAGNQQ